MSLDSKSRKDPSHPDPPLHHTETLKNYLFVFYHTHWHAFSLNACSGVKDGVEMAECAAYAECAPPTTTCTARGPVDQKQDREIEREQSPVYEFILPH